VTLKDELEEAGNWLFRWRSYLPLLLIGLFLVAVKDFQHTAYNPKLHLWWEIFCLFISFFGLGIRIFTIGYSPSGTSGRNTKKQIAKVLNTTGMYSIVRHPLYLGNFFIWLGISLFVRIWWFSLIVMLIFWLYYERIMLAEEKFLQDKFGDAFLKWANETPAFLPRIKNWQPPGLTFSLKYVLKKEYSGFFGIIVSFTFLEIIGNIFAKGKLELDLMWQIIFVGGLVIYLTIRILKKKTKILDTEGR